MKKLNLFYISVFLLMSSQVLFAQAVDKLYLSSAATGRVYDITALSATPTQAIALPTPLVNPDMSATPTNISNLAVGYDAPAGNASSVIFLHSGNASGSAVYKNGVAISPAITLPAAIGGIGTNNVPGNFLGYSYGFETNIKTLYQIYPAPATNLGAITGDTEWTNGTTVSTDAFFDYQNNIYIFLDNTVNGTTTRYLYKISPVTRVATKVVTITGGAATAGLQGMAYLQGYVYIATSTATPSIVVRRINIFDGTSATVATYNVGSQANLDLAAVPFYVPFAFTCSGITQTNTVPFVAGTASNSQNFLTIPISNVYGPGTYVVNVTGTDFTNPATSVNITAATTSIQIPLIYNGTGVGGTRTLTVNLNGSSTACSVNVFVDNDTDGDGIPDATDLDDDNDGILDGVECNFICNNPFINGGFEFPVVAGSTNVNQNTVGLGWQTTAADGLVELWRTGFNGVTAAEGSQFAEINGTQTATLYQTFCLNGTGGTLNWSVKHRGRSGTDVAAVKFGTSVAAAQAAAATQTMSDGNTAWGTYSGSTVIPAGNNTFVIAFQAVSTSTGDASVGNFLDDIQISLSQSCLDSDGDGIVNSLDVDSDNDGCPDAIEGSEAVKYDQVHALTLPSGDANYKYRGMIKVIYNGTTAGTPAQIISTSAAANGVPQLVNNAGNNLNASTNPSNLAGVADNTDGTSDIGQGLGDSENAAINSCICYKPTVIAGTVLDTNHGISSLQRAGNPGSNWPMVRKGAWTALESKTKGFVPNRLTAAQITTLNQTPANLIEGMMVYNITLDCLQINTDGTATGWKCFNTQTCSDVN